ncbi:MAG TPA: DNA methyltransferase, partial [Gaiellaceae bacterium]|nr:DNA methyltransferase [Gaiellaceae bacterium]
MQPSSEEIRERLAAFAADWSGYDGSERSEAHTFLNELLACFGTDRKDIGARFEERAGSGFMDMIWPGVCIVEMKRPSEAGNLAAHREQAFDYWKQISRETGNAGRFVLVCAFHRFEVFEPGAFWDRPVADFDLTELPDRYESLDFLREREPRFSHDRAELTRGAVALVTDLYNRLADRRAEGPDTLRDFVLQCVWCMFAEDLGMIPESRFSRVIERLREDPERSSGDELGGLFQRLNTPGPRPEHGIYEGVPYANGGLFESPAAVHLERDEVELLAEAASYPWQLVEPAIFGSLLEGALGRDRVWAFGAHYTAEEDIRKVVEPTIVQPWRARIDACETLDDIAAAARDLAAYRVLDPACGSGNFLYVAYRELRRVETALRARERELRAAAGLGQGTVVTPYPLDNVYGIELEPFAVRLARVTLWMAHKLAVVELGLQEPVLPLEHLAGVRRADALKVEWPPADAIVGNPPYIGTKLMRSRLGDDYVDWLKREFGVGVKDFAVYWIRKAHEQLQSGDRAGLVTTNSVREGRNREAGLDYVLTNGGVIVDAISSEAWSGAANVHVSIVNWVKKPKMAPTSFILDERAVTGITGGLRPGGETDLGGSLAANRGRQFFGVVPGGAGFVVTRDEAERLLATDDAEYSDVVRPFLIGADITNQPDQAPSRFIIDFSFDRLEDAMRYPAALEIVRRLVKPHRDQVKRKVYREKWWRLEEPIVAMREALIPLARYIACPAQSKRIYMSWCNANWLPSNLTSVFAFDDDYSMGVLHSKPHLSWATVQSTKLKSDPRYTTASFVTFPWPQPSQAQRDETGALAAALIERRQEICLERQIGLTKLYNEIDDGAYRDLAGLHRRLDEA